MIRSFLGKDREALRAIACDTALMGESCDRFFDGRDIVADALTRYYTDYEPGSCFVAEAEGRVIGYIIGSVDVAKARKTFARMIAWPIAGGVIASGALFKIKNIRFLRRVLWSMLCGEFKDPSFAKEYPAELHINIAEGWRTHGTGARLIAVYLNYLRSIGVAGVHFATFSDGAAEFFRKQGFEILYQTQRSYFRHVLGRDVNLYIFGKRLSS